VTDLEPRLREECVSSLGSLMEALDRFLEQTAERLGSAVDDWIAGAATLLGRLQERWELELDEPDDDVTNGLRIPATRAGTVPVVLRMTYPDGWFAEETTALVHWDGRGVTSLIGLVVSITSLSRTLSYSSSMTVALGTSIPTSITVVETRTLTSPARKAAMTVSLSSGRICP